MLRYWQNTLGKLQLFIEYKRDLKTSWLRHIFIRLAFDVVLFQYLNQWASQWIIGLISDTDTTHAVYFSYFHRIISYSILRVL